MAYAKLNFELVFFFLFHLPVLPSIFVASPLKENQHRCAFDAIFQLGDSTSDTDNLIQEDPSSSCIRFPYGETFFKKPTGRCSDELLIIDYINCAHKLKSSLFIVGEVGSNDYTYALLQDKTIEEVKAMVPEVKQAINDVLKKIIDYGGRRVVVPGHFPNGCLPIYLTRFKTNDTTAYDEFQCLKELNNL
ncbi:hypothetical protein JCGZ_24134 [Jatropha curcas]|uniref:SGNH hydrolase-type esterase domain-containing protein n=1 Tax=Jatropha curcas TaxID=180498 RepID=A0A067L5D8_JATCU|nr:hypothetical protein JCGZ_24134 [Jatropha curcas]